MQNAQTLIRDSSKSCRGTLLSVLLINIVAALLTLSPTCQEILLVLADVRHRKQQKDKKKEGTELENAWLSTCFYLIRASALQCLKHELHSHLVHNLTEVQQGQQPKWMDPDH